MSGSERTQGHIEASATERALAPVVAPAIGRPPDRPDVPSARPDFDEFYRREFPSLVAFARALSGSSHADDLAQEAMLRAFTRWETIAQLDVPAAWVRRVCANTAVSAHRRRLVEAKAMMRLGGWRREPTLVSEGQDQFWSEVRRLPRRQAQAVALFYALDLSVADIARTLQLAEGTVKVHLSRGRAALAQRFGTDLGTDSEEGS